MVSLNKSLKQNHTVAMMRRSRVRRSGTVSDVSPSKGDANYRRGYLFLKAQNTILNSLKQMIESMLTRADPSDKTSLDKIYSFIVLILNAKISELFNTCQQVMDDLRTIACDQTTSEFVDKMCNSLISSALSFLNFSNILFCKQQPETSLVVDEEEDAQPVGTSFILDDELVVCRVCDELVPLHLMEEHTVSCFSAYKTAEHLEMVNKKIKQLMLTISEEFLNVEWPGPINLMTNKTLIALHIYLVAQRAYNVHAEIMDSLDELDDLVQNLCEIKANTEFAQILRNAIENIQEKSRHAFVIAETSKILSSTRVSGSAKVGAPSTTSIDDFTFLKKVSSGAYASVFIAEKKSTKDIYAIKVQSRKGLQQKNQMKRVVTEKNILIQFCSDYLVNFYWSLMGKHNLYLVMEYLPGGDLYSLLQNVGCLDEKSTKIYTVQIVKALQMVHSRGIIHRDLKPDNILIAANGHLKLTDFGLSHLGVVGRQSATDSSLPAASSLVGTPDYIAPEILMNQPHTYAVDFWSLGVIVYELLTGEPPFHGETETETHTNILRRRLEYDPEYISPEAWKFISNLLEINPKKRLGVHGADEVLNSDWLKDTSEDEPPPFVPELRSATDTGYFLERYGFGGGSGDSDILADIELAEKARKGQIELPLQRKKSADSNDFASVGVSQLAMQNEAAVQKRLALGGNRSPSFDAIALRMALGNAKNGDEEVQASPLIVQPQQESKKGRYRLYERRNSQV